jgi:hypothetical protein
MYYYKSGPHASWLQVRQVFLILTALNRRQELIRLEKWANARRFAGPLRLYRAQRFDTERALMRYSMSSPRSYQFANILCWLNRILFPAPRYLPKGSAAAYRYLKRESRQKRLRPIVKLF